MSGIKNRFLGKLTKEVKITEGATELHQKALDAIAQKLYDEDFPKSFTHIMTIDKDNDVKREVKYEINTQTYYEDDFQLQVEYELSLDDIKANNKYENEQLEKDEKFILDSDTPSYIQVVVEIGGHRHRVYGAKSSY